MSEVDIPHLAHVLYRAGVRDGIDMCSDLIRKTADSLQVEPASDVRPAVRELLEHISTEIRLFAFQIPDKSKPEENDARP
ncbi:Uncharacterised protein [Mycobacteroides abscessus subsp. abscessus]|uniref:hypothetical protein n=1 Tax=Mycobacteroides abscessus TaxID=36809 RepID=UPI000929C7BB|nr:hypothetical protein [Mycobacteroides abscessus]SHZ38383.1 Uncharacterised protein [Mycobacteroides abscessus subsp. abscessus]SHZ40252.1 Uncharacterised protein [Mycobacteroides abscessus subsp. abscessus]